MKVAGASCITVWLVQFMVQICCTIIRLTSGFIVNILCIHPCRHDIYNLFNMLYFLTGLRCNQNGCGSVIVFVRVIELHC